MLQKRIENLRCRPSTWIGCSNTIGRAPRIICCLKFTLRSTNIGGVWFPIALIAAIQVTNWPRSPKTHLPTCFWPSETRIFTGCWTVLRLVSSRFSWTIGPHTVRWLPIVSTTDTIHNCWNVDKIFFCYYGDWRNVCAPLWKNYSIFQNSITAWLEGGVISPQAHTFLQPS